MTIPNHHATHAGFAGPSGYLFALLFTVGRGRVADLAVRLTGTGPGDDVVDVGCGPGVAARRAADAGATVVGVDPAPVMLRVGRITTSPRAAIRYVEGAAEVLPLPEGSASVLWSLACVHHWHDLDGGLLEARRVLRPGGRLLAVERVVAAGARGFASHGWTGEQAAGFADRCTAAGFTDVEVAEHEVGRGRVLTVLAAAPPRRGPG